MRDYTELDPYEIAYVCGGPERVAMVVLVALHEDGQVKISSARHRVEAIRCEPRDGVEAAALEVIPGSGKLLEPVLAAIANSSAVEQVGRALRDGRLLPSTRFSAAWQWSRAKAARGLRRRLIMDPGSDNASRVAALGSQGIADAALRRVFETPDPSPVKIPRMRLGSSIDPLHSNNAPDRSGELNSLL